MAGAAPLQPAAAPSGVLVVDKPEGPTSHDVVACARRALRQRQVGHAGTLDPMATGVLVLVVGRATRLAQFLSGREKSYEARIRLGISTDTWDRTGTVVSRHPPGEPLPDADAIRVAIASFLGEHEQAAPAFSAKKIGGVRAYDLAREGRPVAVAPSRVTLHSVEVTAIDPPCVDLRLRCSAGYYVRALADSLGRRLGCGACLEALRRTASGAFSLEAALTLDTLVGDPDLALARLVPPEAALPDLPAVVLDEAGARRARHGNEVGPADCRPGSDPGEAAAVRLLDPSGRLLAVGRPAARRGFLHPVVVLG